MRELALIDSAYGFVYGVGAPPATHAGEPTSVPLSPTPEESSATLPVPSSSFQYPARPLAGAHVLHVLAKQL